MNKAVESTKKATLTDGKGGVFWHTQGSGKSLSMVFYAHLLQEALDSPTLVVLTDRNDLDDQLYGQFAKCKDFLRQEPIHAESREHLKMLLDGRQANGIIFTTMQKFEESHEALSERRNIIVMADEAHRGQYGLKEKVDAQTGKIKIGTARMIVTYSRAIAIKIYRRILELRPEWTEKVAVVMTESNKDPEEWRQIIGNKRHKDELAKKFKDNDSPLKIAIVVDMRLTGFDVPSLATMYVYKPMQGYNLMQAIARVNRVFKEKEGGLVVDYVGIASALKEAMNDYTNRDRKKYGDTDVAKVAYPQFLEKLSICRDVFHGYDYSKFMTGTDMERSKAISGAVNCIVVVDREQERENFIKESLMLWQALSLCASLVEESLRIETAFFESVRVLVMRLINKGEGKKISLPEMNARINELLKQSIKSDGVINLFSDVPEEFSLFDPKFLEEISKMKEKNLAVELLKKLIAEQVQIYRRTNVVKSEKFSEIIQNAMNRYLNGMLTNEQVIEELLNLAKQIAAAQMEGNQLGLTADELAFYDALTKPQAIKDFYENEELIAITKELEETLRKNRTIDWQKRDSARAKMRMMIKKLLKKHRYPPEGMDDAVQTVMTQCELWTDSFDMEENIVPFHKPLTYYAENQAVLMVAEEKTPYGKE